jgi:DNA-binding response OmpR family regulator
MAHARKKILCVEDDRETAALVAEELVERGFEVRVAYNGQEGLLAILKDKPDLVRHQHADHVRLRGAGTFD